MSSFTPSIHLCGIYMVLDILRLSYILSPSPSFCPSLPSSLPLLPPSYPSSLPLLLSLPPPPPPPPPLTSCSTEGCNSLKFTQVEEDKMAAMYQDYQEIKLQEQVQHLEVGTISLYLVQIPPALSSLQPCPLPLPLPSVFNP